MLSAALSPWGPGRCGSVPQGQAERGSAVGMGRRSSQHSLFYSDVGRADPRVLVGVGGMWELRHRFMNPVPVV